MDLFCGRKHPLFDRAPNKVSLEEVIAGQHAARGYVSNAQLPAFERRLLVGASSATVEGLVTLVLSGKYTAYLPAHYARHWTATDEIRPILPETIGYTSLYQMVVRKGKKASRLLTFLVETLRSLHDPIEQASFSIGTSIVGDDAQAEKPLEPDAAELREKARRPRRQPRPRGAKA